MSSSRKRLTAFGIVTAVSALFFIVSTLGMGERVEADTLTPLLGVRDCLSGNGCPVQINPFGDSTGVGVQHGALFNHVLAGVAAAGGGANAFRLVTVVLSSLAVGILFLVCARAFGFFWGVMGALAYLVIFGHWLKIDHSMAWNPSLLSLPAVLYLWAAVSWLRDFRDRHLIFACFWMSIAIQAHVAAVLLAFGIAYLIALGPAGRRFGLAFMGGAVSLAAVQMISPGMLVDTSMAFQANEKSRLLVAAVLLLALAAVFLFYVSRNPERFKSPLLFVLLTQSPFFAIKLLGDIEPRYVQALVPGLAMTLVGACRLGEQTLSAWHGERGGGEAGGRVLEFVRGGRLIRSVVVSVAIVFVVASIDWRHSSGNASSERRGIKEIAHPIELTDARSLSEILAGEHALTYSDAFSALRGGPNFWSALTAIAVYHSDPVDGALFGHDSKGGIRSEFAVYEIARPRGAFTLPPRWRILRAMPGSLVLLQEYTPALRWREFEVCWAGAEGISRCDWRQVEYVFRSRAAPSDRHLVSTRECPTVHGMRYPQIDQGSTLLLRVPVEAPKDGRRRYLHVPDLPGPDLCSTRTERIVSVDGVPFEGEVPGATIALLPVSEDTAGSISFAWEGIESDDCVTSLFMPPSVLELSEAGASLMRDAGGLDLDFPGGRGGMDMDATERESLALDSFPQGAGKGRVIPWEVATVLPAPGDDARLPEPLVPRVYVLMVLLGLLGMTMLCVVASIREALHCAYPASTP